jgi:predicted HTH transcriptional regulator
MPPPALAPAQGLPDDARGRRLARAAALIRERGRISHRELQAVLDLSHATATAYLADLIARGLVRRDAPTASPRTHSFHWAGGD